MMKRVLMFLVVFFGSCHCASADVSAVFNEIVNALKSENYPVKFIENTVEKIHDIQFVEMDIQDWNAGYHFISRMNFFQDWLTFPKYFKACHDEGFKKLSQLDSSDLDNIYHEIWHAYFQHNHVRKTSTYYKSFAKRAARVYPRLKRKDAETALEEAMGVFIGQMISHYATRLKFQNDLINHPSLLPDMLEMAQRNDYIGYYYDANGKIIADDTALPMSEKNWLLNEIFELKFGLIPGQEVVAVMQR